MNSRNRIFALDLLRFAAAFAVVLYHYLARPGSDFGTFTELSRFGYLGVPVFFMISGYVIAMSAQGRTAYQFGVSRFARLYPGLWAGLLFTVMAVYAIEGELPDPVQLATNAMLINDYVGQPDIDGVYWTLHVELKFYACVFLLVATGLFSKFRIWLSAWLLMTIFHFLTGQPSFMGWFINPSWSPYFIAGVSMHLIGQHGVDRFSVSVYAVSVALCAYQSFNIAGNFISVESQIEPTISSIVVVISAFMLLAIANQVITVRGASWIATMGAMTYPLYLIHNRVGKAIIDGPLSGMSEGIAVPATTILIIVFAYLIYRFIERPAGNAVRQFGFSLPYQISGRETPAREQA